MCQCCPENVSCIWQLPYKASDVETYLYCCHTREKCGEIMMGTSMFSHSRFLGQYVPLLTHCFVSKLQLFKQIIERMTYQIQLSLFVGFFHNENLTTRRVQNISWVTDNILITLCYKLDKNANVRNTNDSSELA